MIITLRREHKGIKILEFYLTKSCLVYINPNHLVMVQIKVAPLVEGGYI